MAYMQQRGIGAYDHSGDWTWEFYPPPYNFLAPRDSVAMPAPIIYTPLARSGPGLSGCGCGGACGSCHSHAGGLGLFDSGFDVSQWGVGEWVATAAIGYLSLKILGDVSRGARSVKKRVGKIGSKSRRKAQLKRELEALG
jgi:hypothetical protein